MGDILEYQKHLQDQMRRIEETHAEWITHTDACAEGLSCLERKALERRETSLRNTLAEIMADAPAGTAIHGFIRMANDHQTPAYRIKSLSSGNQWVTHLKIAGGRYRRCTEIQSDRFRVIY